MSSLSRPPEPRRAPLASSAPAIASVLLAAASFAVWLWLWESGGGSIDEPWAPSAGLRLSFELDGLGALYGLLATGIGAVVFAYAGAYVPLHLEHQGRPARDARRFFGFLVLFMISMVGLATATDLILLFLFWDLTAVASYFLIGFDRHESDARRSALMALLVTGISAVLLLIAAVMLHAEYGSYSLELILARAEPGTTVTVAAALIAVAGLAKSAQVPFQFWLPRAMAAPTPVSAYLHSAAMVAAGVFLLSRTYPLLQQSELVLDGLLAVGLASIAVGGVLALQADELKQVLAHSTVSQYGYVVLALGLGGAKGALAACFYVLAHAVAKCALFLTAGAVTEATDGRTRLSELGGLARELPWLAAGSLVAAASVAALPLTAGFFKDELFFGAALERGGPWPVVAALAAGLTFAYMGRFWGSIFLGPLRAQPLRLGVLLQAPVVLLAVVSVGAGIVVGPFAALAEAAGAATFGAPTPGEPAYHLDLRAENLMALAAYAVGAALLALRAQVEPLAARVARIGDAIGPERLYRDGLALLNRMSDSMHDLEVRDLRTRIAAVLVPGGVLIAAGFAATPTRGAFDAGGFRSEDAALALVLLATAVAAFATTRPRDHLQLVLCLSGVGFSLAVVYALLGAPDVALVAIVVETLIGLVFLGVFALVPRAVLAREARIQTTSKRKRRNVVISVIAGVSAFVVVWSALSRPASDATAATRQLELTESVHAKDTVTAILADFRGLDTMVEVTVIAVAMLTIMALLGRRGLR